MSLTRETLIVKLENDERWLIRGLMAINERQTQDEQQTQATRNLNGRGFKPCHARMGTSMVEFYNKYKRLSPKQVAYWKVKDRRGTSRIACYANQLLLVAAEKESSKTA